MKKTNNFSFSCFSHEQIPPKPYNLRSREKPLNKPPPPDPPVATSNLKPPSTVVIKKGLKRNDVNRSAQDYSIVDILDTKLSDLSLNKDSNNKSLNKNVAPTKLLEPKSYNNVPKPYQKPRDNLPKPTKIPTRKTTMIDRPTLPPYQTKIPQIETEVRNVSLVNPLYDVKVSESDSTINVPSNNDILEISNINLSPRSQGSSPLLQCRSPKIAPFAPTSFEPHAEYDSSVEQMGSSTVFPNRDDLRVFKDLFLDQPKSDHRVRNISKLVNCFC